VRIYRSALGYFLVAYLVLLATWCTVDSSGPAAAGPPPLVMMAPAGLALIPPLPARELPTPPESPLELFSSLEAVRTSEPEAGVRQVVLVFSHPVNFQFEPAAAAGGRPPRAAVLLYPVDRASLVAGTGPLGAGGFAVSIEMIGRFAARLTVGGPHDLAASIPPGPATGRTRTLILSFRAAGATGAGSAVHVPESPRPLPRPLGRLANRATTRIAPGASLRTASWVARWGGHSTVHAVELDMAGGALSLALGVGSPVIRNRTPLSEMARRAGALAALNASYFAEDGQPLGLLIDRTRVVASPIYGRSSFGIYRQRRFLWGNPEFSGRIHTPAGDVPVVSLNGKRPDVAVTVYTPDFGDSTRTSAEGLEAAVAAGRVVGLGTHDMEIPREGIVIAVHGDTVETLAELEIGDEVGFDWGVTPPWSLCDLAIGGGPRLVRDGRPDITSAAERFAAGFSRERAPRSAVGATGDGRLLLVAIDGRNPPRDCGVTLAEAAQVMIALGCQQAMNLDGGGSTTMVVGHRVVNSPSDGRERGISTGILVLPAARPVQAAVSRAR
jgi:hypothetical protein